MTLRNTYSAFLAAPSASALADHAALHYVSTLTSIHSASAIITHLSAQAKVLNKTNETVLDTVEASHSLSVDVETTIEFRSGGGAYLPGLDDNFIRDRKVVFPMVHVVHFDAGGKIRQIRLYWDQGSLLKQLDVIGSRSRNWPIRDGKDQSRLISTCAAAAATPAQLASATASRPSSSRGVDEVHITSRSRGSTQSASNEDLEPGQSAAPRLHSAKPPPRNYSELFVGDNANSPSPVLQDIPVKAGGGKNYKPNRLFEDVGDGEPIPSDRSVKTHPKKFHHFEFGDGEDAPKAREAPSSKQNQPNWDFEDFATPSKPNTKTYPQAARHLEWSGDEEPSPTKRHVTRRYPDADIHFEFVDDSTPEARGELDAATSAPGNQGQSSNASKTSKDKEDGTCQDDVEHLPGGTTTAIKKENRSKDFGVHWTMADESPGHSKNESRTKAVPKPHKATSANWNPYHNSPESRGINIAGNGMGGRKGTEASWTLGAPPEEEPKATGNGAGGRKKADNFWDF